MKKRRRKEKWETMSWKKRENERERKGTIWIDGMFMRKATSC